MKSLSINIDMGAINNGIFVATCQDDKIIDKNAFDIKFDKGKLNFSKIERTLRRHTRRSFDRDRFVLRLLGEILPLENLSNNQKEKLFGLFKNRGFNYLNVNFSAEIDSDSLEILNALDGYYFKDCRVLSDFENSISKIFNELENDEILAFLDDQAQILNQAKEQKNKILNKNINAILEFLESIKNESFKNNKHRKSYLKDIKNEIENSFKDIILKLKIFKNSQEFYYFIGNIANFQTRILRRYFNAKFDLVFDDAKLKKNILRNTNYLDFISTDEKANKSKILENLDAFSALEFLKNTDPIVTIPPYENAKNKKPQSCQALVINDEKITPSLKDITRKILSNSNFERLKTDENGVLADNIKDNEIAKYLQRILDISKGILDDKELYPRLLEKDENAKIFAQEIRLNSTELKEFKDFAKKYYDEVNLAKKGIIKNELLKPCCLHTPHKNKNKNALISALFLKSITQKEIENLEDFFANNKISGNQTFKGFFERLSELKKRYQNRFYHILEHEPTKELQSIIKNYKKVMEKIVEHNSNFSFKAPFDDSTISTNFNYLTQLGDIIFDEKSRGFAKTCKFHTLENLIRSSAKSAIASRLASNSARLINGKIEMYLDRLAHEIIKKIDFTDIYNVQINVEMNKFNFESNLSKLGLAKERQKDEESFICPYSGAKISQTNCEYDHILPRSKGLYNSLANLIPTSSTSNQIKSNTKYLLSNLDENYLKYIFAKTQTTDLNSFKAFIDENISKIDENDFTNFKNLSFFEQIAFRHALFLDTDDNSFKKALRLLKLDTIKTHSNGTQKRFINVLIEKISKLTKSGIDINFIDSKLVSSTRKDLAQNDINIAKQEIQDSHSHCVDASIVFYLANSKIIKGQIEPDYDYFKDIYPKNSDIILPQSKKYLELNQKSQKSKKLFDDSVYSLVYEGKFDEKQKKILTQYELLKENGFVDTHKVFELIFKSFKDKDRSTLKDIKFLDNHLKSYIRKDIFSIFFNEKGELKEAKELKSATKNIDKFYTILSQNQDKIYTIKLDEKAKEKKILQRNKVIELYKEIFYTKNAKPRARGKNRVTFSLPVYSKDAKYAIRRNSGFAGLKNANIATKTYINIDSIEILKIPYYSTNVLPISISDILEILSLQSKNAKQIYKIKIADNLPEQIVSLDFILSQANRHEVLVSFDKSKLEIQNINDDNDENAFIQKYLCDDFKEFLGKPRDNKIEIIKNNDDILAIKYCVESTSKANKEIIVKALSDEAPSA